MLPATPVYRVPTAGPNPPDPLPVAEGVPAPREATEFQERNGDPCTWGPDTWETWLHLGGLG